jgi:hypothetical protein
MKQEKEYFAFISYKREDEEWAKWLARELDSYKLPSSLNGKDMPPSLRKTFRDIDELSAGNLPKQIYNALSKADNLIVVCSPRSANSKWVNKEIEDFIKIKGGKSDRIFPFIIEGEPFSKEVQKECFPKKLRELPQSEERLGGNVNEQGGRNAAVVKVVSGMLGVSFDSLWNRFEREQKRKRWIWTGVAAVFTFIGLGVGAYFVSQNRIIEFQNVQLQKLVRNLEEENNTYSQLEGDKKQYVYVGQVRGNGCDDLTLMLFDFHPYEPIVAFYDDWGVWLHYLNSNVEVSLPTNSGKEPVYDITEVRFSADGKELMAEGYGLYIWDVETCKLVAHYSWGEDRYKDSPEFKLKFPSYDDETNNGTNDYRPVNFRYEYQDGKLNIFKKTTTELICSTEMESEEDSTQFIYNVRNPIYNETMFVTSKRAAIYDEDKKVFVLFFKGFNSEEDIEISESGEYIRVDKNIYVRTMIPDTIQITDYAVKPIADFPLSAKESNPHYDTTTGASIEIKDNSFTYKRDGLIKEIEVIKSYSMGNTHSYFADAVFAGSDKIVAIVGLEKHRVYSTRTWNLIGTFGNDLMDESMGNEGNLAHADSGLCSAMYINGKLYVLTSGGVIRVYDVAKCRLERVIVLPYEIKGDEYIGPIDKVQLAEDGSEIDYSFREQSKYYHCSLLRIK